MKEDIGYKEIFNREFVKNLDILNRALKKGRAYLEVL